MRSAWSVDPADWMSRMRHSRHAAELIKVPRVKILK
jgi:hypothetical protein